MLECPDRQASVHAYLAERAGALGDRFGTATPAEALDAHRVFAAALASDASKAAIAL